MDNNFHFRYPVGEYSLSIGHGNQRPHAPAMVGPMENQPSAILCQAILFDMDGVLINSVPAVTRVWRNWARERGFDPETVVQMAHGRPSLSTVRDLLPHADHEAENREVERREIADIEGIVPLPGAAALLRSLPRDRWAIVTSCTRPLAEVRIRAAGLPVPDLFITASDVTHGKPHPEPYLTGAARLGFAASECIVVEDVPAGIRSGKSAGARVMGFTPTCAAADLTAAGADWILPGCANISVMPSADARSGSGQRSGLILAIR